MMVVAVMRAQFCVLSVETGVMGCSAGALPTRGVGARVGSGDEGMVRATTTTNVLGT